ncbi:MAG: glycosyltransferase family 4 protein [Patescibacteria group bacterium]|nr:glycosyltransferase family 4 protein [Patescibacteria group bacterium]
MKIAIIGSKGIPCRDGGVERHTEELAVRLVKAGHEVLVYSRRHYTQSRVRRYKGVRIIYTPYIPTKNLAAITHTLTSLIHVLFQKVDIIHIHSVGPSLLAFLPRLLKRKTQIIATFHSRDRFNKKWGYIARLFLALGEWATVKFPHATITVSKNLYSYCRRKYPTAHIFYIPNGAPLFPPQKAQRIKKWGLTENSYILSVSRLIPLKGIHYLIRAFQNLNLNKKLVIVGDNPKENQNYLDYLKELAQNNPNVVFLGHQQGKILNELLSNAYLYVLPSEVEGLSISLLEAMGSGRCVLVSDIPENQEAIGEAGYTFKSKSFVDLTQKILFLNDHPELVLKNGHLARERVKRNYNWQKITRQTLSLYAMLKAKNPIRIKNSLPRIAKTHPIYLNPK